MNAIRPQPMRAERSITFKAWRDDRPVTAGLPAFTCIDEAADYLAPLSPKGTVLTILMTDTGRNKSAVAFYKVRESSKRYTWRASTNGGKPVKVGALEPQLLHVLDVLSFVPAEAFDAFRDEPTGRDFGLVVKQEEWR
jgi:hypothetical protein